MRCRRFNKHIDAYLRGELPKEKLHEFEAHYFECQECFDQLRIRRVLMGTNFELQALSTPEPRQTGWKPRRAALAAASVMLLIGAGILGLELNRQRLLKEVSRFSPPTILLTETRNAQPEDTFRTAVNAYHNGDYAAALKHLDGVAETAKSPKMHFLSGICRLLTDDPAGALRHFDWILDAMEPSYFDEALFYKGIALLRQGRLDEARTLFSRLAEMFSPMRQKAKLRLEIMREKF